MELIALVVWLVATSLVLLGGVLAVCRFKLNRPELKPRKEPITILKPICGVGPDLKENLASFFRLRYFKGDELIFCTENLRDPAVAVVEELIRQYPKCPARIWHHPTHVGPNPKINNIYMAYVKSRNDLILISDDNALADADYLTRLDGEFTSGILTAVILVHRPRSLGGRIEQGIMSTFYARGLVLAHAIGHPCVMGKSMLFRRSEMSLRALSDASYYLAEDYAMGLQARQKKLPVSLMSRPVYQHVSPEYGLKDFWKRHVRWGLLRKWMAAPVFVLEPFFYSFFLTGLIGSHAGQWTSPAAFWAMHASLWLLGDGLLALAVDQNPTWFSIPEWFVREALYLPMWCHMVVTNRIDWKTHSFKIGRLGKIKAV